jgi:hypothetical protein
LPIALQAFLDYQPIVPPATDPTPSIAACAGQHVEIFLLDTPVPRRLGRARLDAQPKTMLGAEQVAWA